MPVERTIEFQGQRIWTEALGSTNGTPIILISGAGAHAHFWTDTFCHPFLQRRFYVIRYDHRDVGFSHPSSEGYDLIRLAKDAIEILDSYNIHAAHVVGHSMGGYIAQLLAAECPERILSMTLLSSAPLGETPDLEKSHTSEEREMLHITWSAMLRNRPTDDFEVSWEGYLKVWKRLNGLYPVDGALAKHYTQEMYTRSRYPPGVHDKHMEVIQKAAAVLKQNKDIFSKIHVPVLILHGEKDYLIPPSRGGCALSKVLPHALFCLIPEMGHMLFNYNIERLVANEIISFLQSFKLTS